MFDSIERQKFLKSFVDKNPQYYKDKSVKLSYKESVPKKAEQRLERWDYLHKLAKVLTHKQKQIQTKAEENQKRKEFQDCTFSPKISNRKEILSEKVYGGSKPTFVERSLAWKKRKDTKLHEQIKEKKAAELKACRFTPVRHYY
jgi:hypothetical protein